jgi:hypothetical protein
MTESEPKSKFKVNSFQFVCSSVYNLKSNTICIICKHNLNENSIYDQDKGIESKIVQGGCNHEFHSECISRWININKHCPMCYSVWSYSDKNKVNIN